MRQTTKARHTLGIRGQLMWFLCFICLFLLGLFWLLSTQLLEPLYTKHIETQLTNQADSIVERLDDAIAEGKVLSSWSFGQLAVNSDFFDKLTLELYTKGSLNSFCVDISDTTLHTIYKIENQSFCNLHGTYLSDSANNDKIIATALAMRRKCRSVGSFVQTLNPPRLSGSAQLLVGRITADGSYTVLVTTSLVPSVLLPSSVVYLGNSAFEGCNSFTRIDIPDKIVHIGDRVFADCHALEQITIPPSVHHLGKHIFSGCRSLKTLTVPFPACGTPATFSNFGELFGTTPDIEMRKISQDNETGKETNYYLPHSLSVLRILEGCEVIPSKCLMNCFVLKELHLPSSLYMMGEKAVYGCAGLKTIYCQAAEPASIHADTFGGIRFNVCRLHVPQGSTEKYKQDKHWKYFSQIEEYGTTLQAMNQS